MLGSLQAVPGPLFQPSNRPALLLHFAVACYEFAVVEAALQFVEGCYASLAIRRGVLDKPSARITLRDLLRRHAMEARVRLGGLPASLRASLRGLRWARH